MDITAKDINKLRQLTGVGMMDCKKALIEAEGNIDKAIELLKKRGQHIAASRAGKKVTEGMALVAVNEAANHGAIITLSCETDFVAKNDLFQQLAQDILALAVAQRPANLEALKSLSIQGVAIQDKLTELVGKMGENITLSAYEVLAGDIVVPYLHTGNKLAVLVALQGPKNDQVLSAGRDVAMQIAALNPVAIDKESVPAHVVEQELAMAKEEASLEAKTPAMLEDKVQSRLNDFFKEHTLLNQPFVKDNSMTVAQYLAKVEDGLTVVDFKRVVVGAS